MSIWDRLKQGDREYADYVAFLKVKKCVYKPPYNNPEISQEEVAQSFKKMSEADKIVSISREGEMPSELKIAAGVIGFFICLFVLLVVVIFLMIRH